MHLSRWLHWLPFLIYVLTKYTIRSIVCEVFYFQNGHTLTDGHFKDLVHTPPEGWVRAKKKYITFDTNFGCYLPRGTINNGSRKCRIRAFCTIAKISGEMPKKGLKTGQNGVKFFFDPHTCWILTFVAFFYFQYFFFCCFTDLLFCGN